MKNYIVLDLETPNRYSNSMCSIGIVKVEDGRITDNIYSLIDPEAEFDEFNINFTGITPEDVEGKPTFKEFWKEYEELLTNNLIIGQNITFDLSVISKSLTRYKMPIPVFNYYCTLCSSRRNLNLPDYSLGYIVDNVLKTTYNAHNAMDDAKMTNKLCNYLKDYENQREYVQSYYYRPNCKRDFDRNLDINYNYLYGLLEKFNYKDEITENHYNLIETWYESNNYKNNHPLIQNIQLKVKYVLENNITETEMKSIIKTLKPILRSPKYKTPVLKLNILRGILDSMTTEDTIEEEDKHFLKQWLKNAKINDGEFKIFRKEINMDSKDLKEYLQKYSQRLDEYSS